jgi:uncharacterized membrane protein YkvA (DUF1232 family)
VIVDGDAENMTKLSGRFLPGSTSVEVRPKPAFATKWNEQVQRLQKEAHAFYFVFKHPGTRWHARLVAACTAGYLFSPVQLIPNFIPVIGCLDDLLVLFVGVKLLQKITPADVLSECRELADAAAMRRKDKIRSTAAIVASAAIAMVWLFAAIAASAVVRAYLRH